MVVLLEIGLRVFPGVIPLGLLVEFRAEFREEIASRRALRDQWTDLLLHSQEPNIFLSWEWVTAWLETQGPQGNPHVVLVKDRRTKH